MKRCAIDGCDKPNFARTWCNKHYHRWLTHGDPLKHAPDGQAGIGEARRYFEEHVTDDTDDCILWPFSRRSHGYGQVWVDGVIRQTHSLACERAHGPRPEGLVAAHSCGVGQCFNPRHVRWATQAENIADQLLHGTRLRGEAHGMAVLTEEAVRAIRTASAAGDSQTVIARRHGVSRASIRLILLGKTWKHVA